MVVSTLGGTNGTRPTRGTGSLFMGGIKITGKVIGGITIVSGGGAIVSGGNVAMTGGKQTPPLSALADNE
jgi:hypothetical protein